MDTKWSVRKDTSPSWRAPWIIYRPNGQAFIRYPTQQQAFAGAQFWAQYYFEMQR